MQLGADISEVDGDNEIPISKLDLNRKASNLNWPSIEREKLDRSKSAPVMDCPDFVYNSTGDFPNYNAMTNTDFYENESPFECRDSQNVMDNPLVCIDVTTPENSPGKGDYYEVYPNQQELEIIAKDSLFQANTENYNSPIKNSFSDKKCFDSSQYFDPQYSEQKPTFSEQESQQNLESDADESNGPDLDCGQQDLSQVEGKSWANRPTLQKRYQAEETESEIEIENSDSDSGYLPGYDRGNCGNRRESGLQSGSSGNVSGKHSKFLKNSGDYGVGQTPSYVTENRNSSGGGLTDAHAGYASEKSFMNLNISNRGGRNKRYEFDDC